MTAPHGGQRIEGGTIMDGVTAFERRGYTGQFGSRLGGEVMCFTCREQFPAREVELDEAFRVEGASDPGAMGVVCAVRCPRCAAKGTLVLSYGPMSSPEDAEVFEALSDARAGSANLVLGTLRRTGR